MSKALAIHSDTHTHIQTHHNPQPRNPLIYKNQLVYLSHEGAVENLLDRGLESAFMKRRCSKSLAALLMALSTRNLPIEIVFCRAWAAAILPLFSNRNTFLRMSTASEPSRWALLGGFWGGKQGLRHNPNT